MMTTARYIYGLDPASKNDFFGIVVHELPFGSNTLPKLRHIDALRHQSFDKMYDHLMTGLFKKYEPHYIVIDYNNERTLSDLIIKQYGAKVETIVFSMQTKLMLKEDGLAIMKQGYKLPKPSLLQPRVGQLVSTLAEQLKAEQILTTKTGKTTFDHPSGQHNDLAIAWELSIHGCLRFIKEPKGKVVRVEKPKYNPNRAPEGPSSSLYDFGVVSKADAWKWGADNSHES